MDLRVRKESEGSVETPALSALSVPLVREELLVTEDSQVLTGCQDQRVLKEIVAFLVHPGRKALWEILDARESLVCRVQGVLLVHQESKGQKASRDHWVHQVRMVVQALQDPLETEDPQELWEYQAPRALTVIQVKQGNRDLQECPVKEVLLEKTEKLVLQDLRVQLVLRETEESRDLQV